MQSMPHTRIKVGSIIAAGSFAAGVTSTTTALTLTSSHYTVLCNASGGTFTITLPTAVGISGRIYNIKKTDSSGNAILIDGNGVETIDGDLTKSLNLQNESITIQTDGSNWYII